MAEAILRWWANVLSQGLEGPKDPRNQDISERGHYSSSGGPSIVLPDDNSTKKWHVVAHLKYTMPEVDVWWESSLRSHLFTKSPRWDVTEPWMANQFCSLDGRSPAVGCSEIHFSRTIIARWHRIHDQCWQLTIAWQKGGLIWRDVRPSIWHFTTHLNSHKALN